MVRARLPRRRGTDLVAATRRRCAVKRLRFLALVVLCLALSPLSAFAQGLSHPPEFAPLEEVLWGCNDTYLVYSVYRDCIEATNGTTARHVILGDTYETAYEMVYDLYNDGVPLDKTKAYVCAVDSVWMRDYGPLIIKEADGSRTVVDLDYYPGRP
jgi:hypothetical protein